MAVHSSGRASSSHILGVVQMYTLLPSPSVPIHSGAGSHDAPAPSIGAEQKYHSLVASGAISLTM